MRERATLNAAGAVMRGCAILNAAGIYVASAQYSVWRARSYAFTSGVFPFCSWNLQEPHIPQAEQFPPQESTFLPERFARIMLRTMSATMMASTIPTTIVPIMKMILVTLR